MDELRKDIKYVELSATYTLDADTFLGGLGGTLAVSEKPKEIPEGMVTLRDLEGKAWEE